MSWLRPAGALSALRAAGRALMPSMQKIYLLAALAPLVGALVAGLGGRVIGRAGAHTVTIAGVLVAAIASFVILADVLRGNTFDGAIYTWAVVGGLKLEIGFLIDPLTALMMVVVTFVSLMVHIYTVGYMADDPGYQRFFAYISLFTFSMLMLVMSNNFLQLFFGWFWFKRPTAIAANLKAFLVNRVGDFGFVLGIGLVFATFGTMHYAEVFAAAPALAGKTIELLPGTPWLLMTVICICLFIGAMGKSAQFPLHVWLPDSMEGPTPISALIHAATMVTAGIFMVARMSPLFELSDAALSFVIVIGAITAFFMGVLGIVQNDIKRVVAYSTLSQLGYMTVALGASAYAAGIFHLMTHAFFKALLFLAAGSVIIGMHHEQDIRKMGGLWRRMPVTWITALIGSLALIGVPFLSGYYSKDSILIATGAAAKAGQAGATVAFWALTLGVFITAFYSFRMFFLVFHGKPRWKHAAHAGGHHDGHPGTGPDADAHHGSHHPGDHHHGDDHHGEPHESPNVVTVPLVLLAFPSLVIGFVTLETLLGGNFFANSIFVDASRHPAMARLAEDVRSAVGMGLHGFASPPTYLALAGVLLAAYLYLLRPDLAESLKRRFAGLHRLLENKYYLDRINEVVFAGGARAIGQLLWKVGDVRLIDGLAVNGSARVVGWVAALSRLLQSGYIYHYAFGMILGLLAMITLFVTFAR